MKPARAFVVTGGVLLALALGLGPALAAQERGPQGQAQVGERGGPPRGAEAVPRGGDAGPRGGGAGSGGAGEAAVPSGLGSAGSPGGPGSHMLPGLGGSPVRRPDGAEPMPSRIRGGDFSRMAPRGDAGARIAVPRGEVAGVGVDRASLLHATAGGNVGDAAGPVREVPQYSRPRADRPQTGRAVPRDTVPGDARRIVYPVYYTPDYWYWYPYGVGYPWYGTYGLGFLYYDPWWWGTAGYYPAGYYVRTTYAADVGQLRLKVKPRHAEVYVDGYFVGTVDQFDGVFQRLRLRTGGHRIEIRADGYEPLVFDVLIPPYDTVTYTGELKRRVP